MDQKKMGSFIADRRRSLGLTQQTLADRLGVTDKAVSKWERGLSYPDITILSPLAEALGVTERELLNGASALEDPEKPPAPSESVALSYLGTAERERRAGISYILMVAYTASLLLGSFISVLIDLIINHTLTWSLIVLASCVLGWAVVLPFYRAPRWKLLRACVGLTILIVPFLAAVEYAAPAKGWLLYPGIPIVAVSLVFLWVPVLLHTFTRISKWYIGALCCLLSTPFTLLVNRLAGSPSQRFEAMINLTACLMSALVLFVAGFLLHRKRAAY